MSESLNAYVKVDLGKLVKLKSDQEKYNNLVEDLSRMLQVEDINGQKMVTVRSEDIVSVVMPLVNGIVAKEQVELLNTRTA